MLAVILRRLAQLPLILGAVYTVTLVLAWGVPGNPLERAEGRRPPPEVADAMLRQYNLDSFWSFYTSYLARASGVRYVQDEFSGAAAARAAEATSRGLPPPARPFFDFGPSLQYRDLTVNEIIGSSLPVSVTLGAAAMIIATVLGVGAGVIGAARPGSIADSVSLALAVIGISQPAFIIGSVLQLVFAVWLAWFPVGGWSLPGGLVLPAITLSLPFAAYIARLTRVGMIDALGADYIRTARAKGLPERTVLLKHALKNALLPVVTYLGPASAMAMTGSFVVERVFSIPGMGQHFVNAVQNKDLFLILGVVLVYATMLVLLNLAVDVMYRWIDPRTA
ncbi:MAG: ABC transporter permease [Phycisphaeraceae bacterium]|nr:ABC transporter permease [Phycisphaeraceae bacterium]